jgi:hypothetical protein
MRQLMRRFTELTLALGFFLAGQPATAVITAPLHMKQVLKQTAFIFTASVESFDVESRLVVFKVNENLKGSLRFEKLRVALPEDPKDPKRENNRASRLVKRLAVDLPVVFFADSGASPAFGKVREEGMTLFMYSNGTWVQFGGNAKVEGTTMPIRFHHFEPYLRRTFKGATAELSRVAKEVLSAKEDPPAYDPNEPPGIGPEIKR